MRGERWRLQVRWDRLRLRLEGSLTTTCSRKAEERLYIHLRCR